MTPQTPTLFDAPTAQSKPRPDRAPPGGCHCDAGRDPGGDWFHHLTHHQEPR